MKELEIQICQLEPGNFFSKYKLYLEVLSWARLCLEDAAPHCILYPASNF